MRLQWAVTRMLEFTMSSNDDTWDYNQQQWQNGHKPRALPATPQSHTQQQQTQISAPPSGHAPAAHLRVPLSASHSAQHGQDKRCCFARPRLALRNQILGSARETLAVKVWGLCAGTWLGAAGLGWFIPSCGVRTHGCAIRMGRALAWIFDGLLKPMVYTPCRSSFFLRKSTTRAFYRKWGMRGQVLGDSQVQLLEGSDGEERRGGVLLQHLHVVAVLYQRGVEQLVKQWTLSQVLCKVGTNVRSRKLWNCGKNG